jgi:hypothetical protein
MRKDDGLARWFPLSGIAFVALYLPAAVIFDREPGPGASDRRIHDFYADDGNQLMLELAFLLTTIAALFFVWFVGTLGARLGRAEGGTGLLSRIALVSGGAFVVLVLVGAALYQFASDAVDDNPNVFDLDPNTARLLTNAAYTINPEAALPVAAPLVLASSLVFLRTAMLPRWIGWAGVAVAIACLPGFLGLTAAFLAWVVVVAGYLTRRSEHSIGT